MERMGCNWFEFQAMPVSVVEDYIIIMQAEAMAAREQKAALERARAGKR